MYMVGPQDPLDMPHAQRIPTGHRPRRLDDNLECNAIAPRVLEGSYVAWQIPQMLKNCPPWTSMELELTCPLPHRFVHLGRLSARSPTFEDRSLYSWDVVCITSEIGPCMVNGAKENEVASCLVSTSLFSTTREAGQGPNDPGLKCRRLYCTVQITTMQHLGMSVSG